MAPEKALKKVNYRTSDKSLMNYFSILGWFTTFTKCSSSQGSTFTKCLKATPEAAPVTPTSSSSTWEIYCWIAKSEIISYGDSR